MNVMMVVIAAAAAVAVLAGAAAPFDPEEEEDKKQVQILENYSVFSVFNASSSSSAAESEGPGSSPDSLIRFLDTIRSVNHDKKTSRGVFHRHFISDSVPKLEELEAEKYLSSASTVRQIPFKISVFVAESKTALNCK